MRVSKNIILELRTKLGLTQAQFATLFAVTPRTIIRWESGGKISDTHYMLLATYVRAHGSGQQSTRLHKRLVYYATHGQGLYGLLFSQVYCR